MRNGPLILLTGTIILTIGLGSLLSSSSDIERSSFNHVQERARLVGALKQARGGVLLSKAFLMLPLLKEEDQMLAKSG